MRISDQIVSLGRIDGRQEQAKTRQWRYRERQRHCWASYWADAAGAVLDMLIRRKCKMGSATKAKWTKSEGSPSATA
jgi:hypothetical protein